MCDTFSSSSSSSSRGLLRNWCTLLLCVINKYCSARHDARATVLSIVCTIGLVAETEEAKQPRPKPAPGKAKPVPSTSLTRILFPSDPANHSPRSFKWMLPKRFLSRGRTHSLSLPSYPHAPTHRSLLYNINPLYNKLSFPSCNKIFSWSLCF